MKAVVAAFNQEKALVGAFSVITNLWMELFEALIADKCWTSVPVLGSGGDEKGGSGEHVMAAPAPGAVSFLTANLTDDGPQ